MLITSRSTTETNPFSTPDFEKLNASLTGSILLPGEAEYDTARVVWNAAYDRHPAVIVRPQNTEDVVKALNFTREHGLSISMRGGGHNQAGTAMLDGGVALDFTHMNEVVVDPERKIAFVQPGAIWADLFHEAAKYGLSTPGGMISSVGVAGFTLGGGIGWLSRKYGLAIDNLISAEVVTADGRVLVASTDENPDLFWALRGGGGNFGVVTRFELALHPVNMVFAGMVVHPMSNGVEVLKFFRDFSREAPDSLTMMLIFANMPEVGPVVSISVCYVGDSMTGEDMTRPLLEFGPPLTTQVGVIPHHILNSMSDHAGMPGVVHYAPSNYVSDLTDEAIEQIVAFAQQATSPTAQVHVRQLGGAMSNVAPDATAYPHREAPFMVQFMTGWADANDPQISELKAWADAGIATVKPLATGVYVNFLDNEGREQVKAAYGSNYARLADIKQKYDPTNFFHSNQNIIPAEK